MIGRRIPPIVTWHGTPNSEAAYRLKGCTMQIGIIGLGRMGGNIARRLVRHGHEVVVYDRMPKAVMTLADEGAVPATGLEDFVRKLSGPRAIWLMLPAGEITEDAIRELSLM